MLQCGIILFISKKAFCQHFVRERGRELEHGIVEREKK